MIEKILLDYINQKSKVKAFMEKPKSLQTYVLIEKVGGGEPNHLKSATLAIKSIAPSLFKTAELNEEVKNIMKAAIELDAIAKIELNTDYNFTDSDSKEYRYQAVFDVIYY